MDISSLLEVQVDEVQPSEELNTELVDYKKVAPETLKPSQLVSIEETLFYKNLFEYDISQVRFRRLHCTACDVHIGSAPVDAQNMHDHPVLKTLLCSACRIFYGDGEFEQGDDATDMFCRWCANGGNLYCCSYCSNTFCDKCIKRNFDAEIRAKIEADEKWKCFVCDPQDLYMHRAVCRALLQHVRVLARIIMEDRTMSQKEAESKMEMDDSKCCPGRRARRKRRNSDSDFEEDEDFTDEDYPKQRKRAKNGSAHKRRKSTSSTQENPASQVTLNGTARFIPIAPKYVLQEMVAVENNKTDDQEELPPPLIPCEQSMIECENQTVTPQGMVLPASVYPQAKIPDAILNNSAISLNPVSKRAIVRTGTAHGRPITIRPLHKVTSIPPGATIHRLPSNVPMVTIPSGAPILSLDSSKNKPVEKTPQSGNYLRCKSNLTTAPSVINIDSDSEEPMVVESSNTQKVVESENTNKEKETNTVVVGKNKTASKKFKFDDAINHPLKQIDDLLKVFRKRLKVDYQRMKHISDNEVLDKRQKLKIINNNIENVVNDLAAFNNSMVAKYKPWKQAHLNGESFDESVKTVTLKKNERSSKFTPLDMECVRDSEPEEEELEDDDDMDINSLLDFSKKVTKIIEIKDKISQGTFTEIETENKAVQCHGIPEEIDFDKSIGYSLLMRADYDFEKEKETFKPVVIHDEHFGKYEEQFIFYLQDWEDRKENGSNEQSEKVEETPLMDLIDADLTRKDELEKADNQLYPVIDSITTIPAAASSPYSIENSDEHLSNCENVDNVGERDNEKNDNSIPKESSNDCRETIQLEKPKSCNESTESETVLAVNSLVDEKVNVEPLDNWNNPLNNDLASNNDLTSNDDECTIVE